MRTLLPTLAAIAIAAALVLAIDPLREATSHALHGNVDALQAELESLGVVGALVLVSLILVHAVVLFPAEIPNAVAGLTYGFPVALPMVLAAWTASGLIAYYLGVRIGRPAAHGFTCAVTSSACSGRSGSLLAMRTVSLTRPAVAGVLSVTRSGATCMTNPAVSLSAGERRLENGVPSEKCSLPEIL